LVLLERFVDERTRFAFEALGQHARETELRLRIVREDLERLAKHGGGISVLMRLEKQPAPAHARLNGARIRLRDVAEQAIGALDVADRPRGFGLDERVRRLEQTRIALARLLDASVIAMLVARAELDRPSRIVVDRLRPRRHWRHY